MALRFSEYELNEHSIEAISASLQGYLSDQHMDGRNIQRLRLTVEELLLNVMTGLGRGIPVSVGMGKQFGRHLFRIRFRAAPYDPTHVNEDDWSNTLMRSLGYAPSWNCRGGINTVSLILADRKKRSFTRNILIGAVAGILLGLICRCFPEALRNALNDLLVTPLSNSYLGLMRTFSGIMISFTVCSGILGAGNTSTLGKLGKRFVLGFVALSFTISVAASAFVLPFLRLKLSEDIRGYGTQLDAISRLFFEIVPSDPVTPYQTGNTMQIIVIAVIAGMGLLALGERGSGIRNMIDEGTNLLQQIIASIGGFVPIFVFTSTFQLVLLSRDNTLSLAWKPLILIILSELLVALLLCLLTAWRLKCPPLLLLRKVSPPFTTAFTSASSMSAMTLSLDTCENKLGIEKSVINFAYPLGLVIYMPGGVACITVMAFTFAEVYGVSVHLPWMLMAIVTATILVIATPPIQGAEMMIFTVLFSALGIPAEGLALAIAIDILADHLNTGFNVMLLILQMAATSNALGRLNRKVLMSE